MAEREVHVTHTTIMRWVFQFVPEYERRWNRRARPVGSSWRVDETYIHSRPKMGYLYRAVDKQGKTVDSLFQTGRGIAAAMAFFFEKALAFCAPRWPRKITLDEHKPSHLGLRRLRREDHRWKYVLVRRSQYLNNVVEQDHRAIKGRCRSMLSFKSYRTATITLAGLELVQIPARHGYCSHALLSFVRLWPLHRVFVWLRRCGRCSYSRSSGSSAPVLSKQELDIAAQVVDVRHSDIGAAFRFREDE